VDPTALAAVVGAWLADRPGQQQRRRAVAVDGKTLRGTKRDHRQVHLLAAMDHATRAVLAQRQVNGAPGEVPAFRPLLAGLDLAGAVVTADALHTHADAAEFLVTSKQAHYLLVVKANQPSLLDRCAGLPWHDVPVLDRTRDQAHGRVELRTLKAVTVWTVTAIIPLTYAIWLPEGLRRHAIDGALLVGDGEQVAPVGVNLADALVFCLGIFPVLGLTLGVIGAGVGAQTTHRAVPNDPS
jgi:hypothetical protein